MDIVLGHFAQKELALLSPEQLNIYEELLDEDDANIWSWLIGHKAPEKNHYSKLIETLKGYGLPTE